MPFLAGKSDFCQKKNGNIYVTYLQRELEVFFTIGYHLGPDHHPFHLLNPNLLPQPQPHPSLLNASSKGPQPCQMHFLAGLKGLGNFYPQFPGDTRNSSARPFSKSNEQKVPILKQENCRFDLNQLQYPLHKCFLMIQMKFESL